MAGALISKATFCDPRHGPAAYGRLEFSLLDRSPPQTPPMSGQESPGAEGPRGSFYWSAEATQRVGALLVVSDAIFNSHRTRLADLAARSHLPAAYGVRESVDAGGLMSYGPSFLDSYRRAATYVDQILKGAKPAELPVEQPTKYELVINMKTAKALGLTFPQSVLLRADHVIE